MSLLDSFVDSDDDTASDADPMPTLHETEDELELPQRSRVLDTFPSSHSESEDDHSPFPPDSHPVALVPAAPDDAVAPRRGAPSRGSRVLHRLRREAVADAPKKTRSEICRDAAKARWAKKPHDAQPAVIVPQPDVQQLRYDAIVPFVASTDSSDGTMVTFSKHFTTALEARLSAIPELKKNLKMRVETQIVVQCTKILSTKVLSELLKVDPDTVVRKQRLIAATIVLAKRWRAFTVIGQLNELLKSMAHSRGLMAMQKIKYDGVSFRLVLDDADQAADDVDNPNATKPDIYEEKPSVIAKLLQVTVVYACLWKVGERYLSITTRGPTTVRPLDADSAVCIVDGLTKEAGVPGFFKHAFDDFVRLVAADDAGSNGLADLTIWFLHNWQHLLKFVCSIHKEHRVCEIQLGTFASDSSGLRNSSLASQYAGVFRKVRAEMKAVIKEKLVFRPLAAGETGSSPEHARYRQSVLAVFGEDPKGRCSGPQALKRQRRWLCLASKLNGNWEDEDSIEHWCPGPLCCKDAEDCYKSICKHCINPLPRPPDYEQDRWLGSEGNGKWHGLWIGCHNLYGQAFERFCKAPRPADVVAMDALDDANGSEGEDGGDAGGAPADEGAIVPFAAADEALDFADLAERLEDVQPEAAPFQRQKTFRQNTLNWLKSTPLPRLWILIRVHRVQQNAQKKQLKQVGVAWEQRELKRRLAGKKPVYRVVEAVQCQIETDALRSYARIADREEEWREFPDRSQTHDHASLVYRSCASSSAAEFQLQKIRKQHYPFKPFAILDSEGDQKESLISDLHADAILSPCKMDVFWRSFLCKERDVELLEFLKSTDFHHILAFLAEHIEYENGTTEACNALLRRRIRQAIQSRKLDVKDLSCHWVITSSRHEASAITGDKTMDELNKAATDELNKDVSAAKAKMRGGGGGLCRAYINRFKDSHKLPSGRLDFRTLIRDYNAEKAKGADSTILADLIERAATATKVCRAAFSVHGKKRGSYMTSFGVLKTDGAKRARVESENKMLLADLDLCADRLCVAGQSEDFAVALRQRGFFDMVRAQAGQDLSHQLRMLNRLCRLQAVQEAVAEKASMKAVQEKLTEPPNVPFIDLSKLVLPKDGCLRVLPGVHSRLLWVDPCLKHGLQRVASMNASHEDLGPPLEKAWDQHHATTASSSLSKLPELPQAYRNTRCWLHGFGRCLCTGEGELLWRMKQNFCRCICKLAPKGSALRTMLCGSSVVVRVNTSPWWWHIALMYLRPRRPTYVQLTWQQDNFLGDLTLLAADLQDEEFKLFVDVDMLAQLDIGAELSFQLFSIIGVNRPCVPFRPSRRILVQRLCDKLPVPENVKFWDGAEKEIDKEIARLARQAANERRRKEAAKFAAPGAPGKGSKIPRSKAHRTKKVSLKTSLLALHDKDDGHDSDDFSATEFLSDTSSGQRDDDYSWLHADSDSKEGVCNPGNGVDLDMKLSDLLGPNRVESGSDWDLDDFFGDGPSGLAPSLGPDNDDDEDDYDLFGPMTPSGTGSEAEDDGPLGATPSVALAPSCPAVRPGARRNCVEDLSDLVPEGATLRKYAPKGRPPTWLAVLPKDVVDKKGKHTRRRQFNGPDQNEADVLQGVQDWLWDTVDGSPDGEGAASDSSSSSTSKSSSSSSSSSSGSAS